MSFSDSEGSSRAQGEPTMGASASKPTRALVVSLDALGTLYRFREPVAVQYSKIARECGFKGQYDTAQLDKSFKSAFKKQNKLYPNYGNGALPNPQVWWEYLVENTFEPFVTPTAPLPAQTGQRLYEHFTSGEAYELFPDVRPFLETMAELKKGFEDPEGPIVLTGIISNSDPRVRDVITGLGLRVGVSDIVSIKEMPGVKDAWNEAKDGKMALPGKDMYNSGDQFNFCTTSYEAGFEKPDIGIFFKANQLARQLTMSRLFKDFGSPDSAKEAWSLLPRLVRAPTGSNERVWIHIGDDYEKDYEGARSYGHEALLLDREGLHKGKENMVTSLEDAGKAISIMAYEALRSGS